MGEVDYQSLEGKKIWNFRKTTALAFTMITLGVILALIFLSLQFQEIFILNDIPELRNSHVALSLNHEINNRPTFSSYDTTNRKPQTQNSTLPKLICYYAFPGDNTDLQPQNINASLCSHINIAFAGIETDNFTLSLNQNQSKVVKQVAVLKTKNKKLKVLISVGGAGVSSFSSMVKTHKTRKKFIHNLMLFIKQNNLDGVDIDWEFPAVSGRSKEKLKFQQLLQEIKIEFDRHERKYILSVAVAAIKTYIDMAYYVNYMSLVVDYINLMTYDYHFFHKYFPLTGNNAPLYSDNSNFIEKYLNVNFSVNYWIENGMRREQILLGLPIYGHTFRLVNADNHGVAAPASGYGSVGHNGYASMVDICKFLQVQYTQSIVDKTSKVPYAFNLNEWISYDDLNSLELKAKFITENRLGGGMVWCLNTDDFSAQCYNETFPMVKRLNTLLMNHSADFKT